MNKLAILTVTGLSIFASAALAADVSIKGAVSQSLEASDNYFLVNRPSGSIVKSTTAGTLDFLAQTPTTNYLLNTNYSYYKYFGPGTADTSLTWGTPASAIFSIDHAEELSKFNFAASWNRIDTTTATLAQTGIASGHGTIDTYTASGGIAYDLTRIDLISWNAQAAKVSYSDPTQFPYLDFTTMAAWRHDLSATTTLSNSVNFDSFSEDDPAQSQRLFWKLMTGLDSKLSSRLTVSGHVGIGFVNSYQNGSGATILGPPGVAPFQPQAGTANSPVADFSLIYQLLKTTRVTLAAAQAIVPTTFGQLQKSDSIGLTLSHDINQLSSLTFSTQLTFVPATQGSTAFSGQNGNSDFFSASVNYQYRLTRELRANFSYTYLERNDDTGIAKSSIFLIALSRDFTLLGNPTAINRAEQERARIRQQQSVGYAFPNFR